MWIRTFLSACYKQKVKLRLKLSIFLYSLYEHALIHKISSHKPIRIMFYVYNLSAWKSDKLLMLLKNDIRFEPFIVSYLYPNFTEKHNKEIEQNIVSHFKQMGVSFYSGFDFDKKKLFKASLFKPDIVFFPQPYNDKWKDIPRGSLLAYIPYCFEMEETRRFFFNSLFQNICWKYFVASDLHKELKSKFNVNHGSNIVVSGNPLADYFFDNHTPSDDCWPIKNRQIKRIIWAPHHSIMPNDYLDYSNFLSLADEMLEIAKKYRDKAQFVFKPHPALKEKLYKLDDWGVEKTDAYYNKWKELPNGNYCNGNYVDLFITSDALIHDCSSFTGEYLYVNKPVMYITDRTKIESFNSFADACFNMHYHGFSISDIENFINKVIDGTDPLLKERTRFIKEQLMPKENKTVAETIYNELCRITE